MKDWEKDAPVIIESGKGTILTDIHGKKYIDGVSSLWVTVHGHRKKEIDRAVAKQLGKISHTTLLGLSNIPAIVLAEKLIAIAPRGLTKVFYSDSGSAAVEIALKIAFQYWHQKGPEYQRKTGFLSLAGAYHGDTVGSVSVGGIDLFHSLYKPLLFQTRRIDSPHCYRCAHGLTYPECQKTCIMHAEKPGVPVHLSERLGSGEIQGIEIDASIGPQCLVRRSADKNLIAAQHVSPV